MLAKKVCRRVFDVETEVYTANEEKTIILCACTTPALEIAPVLALVPFVSHETECTTLTVKIFTVMLPAHGHSAQSSVDAAFTSSELPF